MRFFLTETCENTHLIPFRQCFLFLIVILFVTCFSYGWSSILQIQSNFLISVSMFLFFYSKEKVNKQFEFQIVTINKS